MRNPLLIVICLALGSLHTTAAAEDIRTAARAGDMETVRALLDETPNLVNEVDNRHSTPLHFASDQGRIEVMTFLLANGADLTAIDVDGDTPLHWAAMAGKDDAVKLLLDHDAEINARNHSDATPVLYATQARRYSTVESLAQYGSDLELANDYRRTPLIWNCREGGNLEMARLLLRLGADPNALDRYQDSSLSLAAWRGFHELVGILLDAGAQTNLRDGMITDLLGYATERGGDRLYQRVVADGVEIEIAPGADGKSILHFAAAGGSSMIVEDLLKRGASPMQVDLYGWNPLHYAASRGRLEATRALIDAGAPLDARTISGFSALNLAEKKGAEDVATLLMDRGAGNAARLFPDLTTPYLGQGDPPAEPAPFAPDIVATCHGEHGSVTISPDGTEIYWSGYPDTPDSGYTRGTILFSHIVDGRWTPPARLSFAEGHGFDVPFFSPDGSRLYFISRKPVAEGQRGGKENIWYVQRQGDDWGEPQPLPPIVNQMPLHWQFSVAASGNLYFNSRRGAPDTAGIYVSRFIDNEYTEPELLGFKGEAPYVAPDESWLITFEFLEDNRRVTFLRFRTPDGGWDEPFDLTGIIPVGGICPKLSPDSRAFFFLGRANNNHWFDAKPLQDFIRKHSVTNP